MGSEFCVTQNDINLYCECVGQGEPLLMIHGGGVDGHFFQETAGMLSSCYQVTVYGRRGYGRSQASEDGDCSVIVQSKDALAVLERQGGKCSVVAHSLGCLIAMELAAEHPSAVKNLILHEPPVIEELYDEAELQENWDMMEAYVREDRIGKAVFQFLAMCGPRDERGRKQTEEELEYADQNIRNFLKNELPILHYQPKYTQLAGIPIVIGVGEQKEGYWKIGKAFVGEIKLQTDSFSGRAQLPQRFAGRICLPCDRDFKNNDTLCLQEHTRLMKSKFASCCITFN